MGLPTIEDLKEWSILTAYRGSIAHNMYIPNTDPNSIDDKDVMAVVVPPIEYFFGLREYGSRGTREIKKGEWDIVIYEIRKVMSLLAKGNPNVLSLLWCRPEHYLKIEEAGSLLIQNRYLFINKTSIYNAFSGYAYAQIKKMELNTFNGYMGQKRKELVEKFGYDTKNAAHAIRLLRMGIEFLETERLNIYREDASELLEIKRGEWSLDEVKDESERLFFKLKHVAKKSKLSDSLDYEAINNLAVKIVSISLGLPVRKGPRYSF